MADPVDLEEKRDLIAKLRAGEQKKEEDRLLEEALKLTFPASDPVAVNTAPEPVETGWNEVAGEPATEPPHNRSQPTTTRGTAGPPYRPTGPASGSVSNTVKDPDGGVTGDEPITRAQESYLRALCTEVGEAFDPKLTKADASRRIDELQAKTGRGKPPA